ncbi:MAG: hypothetical protein JWN46_2604 [Acidimicrobiales bacterium]|nr:hypothetical protein [Acidimicrobiales bacterium]
MRTMKRTTPSRMKAVALAGLVAGSAGVAVLGAASPASADATGAYGDSAVYESHVAPYSGGERIQVNFRYLKLGGVGHDGYQAYVSCTNGFNSNATMAWSIIGEGTATVAPTRLNTGDRCVMSLHTPAGLTSTVTNIVSSNPVNRWDTEIYVTGTVHV